MISIYNKKNYVYIAGFLLVLVMIFVLIIQNHTSTIGLIVDPDSRGYIYPALQALDGNGLHLIYARPFVYPLIIYIVGLISGDVANILYVQIAAHLLSALLIYTCTICFGMILSKINNFTILSYISVLLGLFFSYLYLASGHQLSISFSLRPEIITSFLSLVSINLLLCQFLAHRFITHVVLILCSAVVCGMLTYLSQKWAPFALFLFTISQIRFFLMFKLSARASQLTTICAICIYAGFFSANTYLTKKYDSENDKLFGSLTAFCANLDIISHYINTNHNHGMNQNLASDIVVVYEKSKEAAKGYYRELGFNIDTCFYSANSDENIRAVLKKAGITNASDIQSFARKTLLNAIVSHPLLMVERFFKQSYLPIKHVFPASDFGGVFAAKKNMAITKDIISDENAYMKKFMSNKLVNIEQNENVEFKAFNLIKFEKFEKYLFWSKVIILTSILCIFFTMKIEIFLVNVLTLIFYFVLVFPVAVVHSFDIGRYIVNIQAIIFMWLIFSVLVIAFSTLESFRRFNLRRKSSRKD